MRCGNRAVRGLAQASAPPQQGLWISDELLESTFARFVHQRRGYHGHNPGPLEFRRRQTSRRMASVTFNDATQNSIPSVWPALFHIGSLFRARPALDTQWSWEAPSGHVGSTQNSTTCVDLDIDLPSPSNYERALASVNTISEMRALFWTLSPVGADARKFSQAAMQRTLALMSTSIRHGNESLTPLFDFLDSDMNIRAARNMRTALAWTCTHLRAEEQHLSVMDYISGYIKNDRLSTEELRSLLDIYQIQHQKRGVSARMLEKFRAVIASVENWLSAHQGTRAQLTVAEVFLELLSALPSHWQVNSAVVRTIAALPAALRPDYDDILQSNLLHCIQLDAVATEGPQQLSALLQDAARDGAQGDSLLWWTKCLVDATNCLIDGVHTNSISGNVLSYWISVLKDSLIGTCGRLQAFWAQLDVLSEQSKSRAALLAHVTVPLQGTAAQSKSFAVISRPIPRSNRVGKIATAQIHDFLAKGATPQAMRLFLSTPSVRLASCERLLFDMASSGQSSISTYMRILLRKDQHNSVTADLRHSSCSPLSKQRSRLIEDLAYHISISEKQTSRQSFRMVEALYRYLADRNVKIGPVMSRALLRAGVTRLAQEGIAVPRDRFRWILRVVEQAEGKDVAADLDRQAGQWFRHLRTTSLAIKHAPSSDARPRSSLLIKSKRTQRSVARRKASNAAPRTESMYRLRGVGGRYIVSEEGVRPMQTI